LAAGPGRQSVAGDAMTAYVPHSAREPGQLVRDVLLRDGSTLRLQAPGPADYQDIRRSMSNSPRAAGISGSTGWAARTSSRPAAVESSGTDRVLIIAVDGEAVLDFVRFAESCANVVASAVARREWLSRPAGRGPGLSRPRRVRSARGGRRVPVDYRHHALPGLDRSQTGRSSGGALLRAMSRGPGMPRSTCPISGSSMYMFLPHRRS